MNLTEKTVSQTYVYKGRIINLRSDDITLPDGKPAKREVIEHPGGVCVLPITDDDEIIFVRQYRYPYSEILLEIPAGKRDSKDENTLECGKRELKEETGTVASEYTFLGELYPSPGYVDEIIFMYMATGLAYGETSPDDDEFVETVKIPFDKALDMVMSGQIKDAKTQAAILKVAVMRKA